MTITSLTIATTADGRARLLTTGPTYECSTTETEIFAGTIFTGGNRLSNVILVFPLTSLPSPGLVVESVALQVTVSSVSGGPVKLPVIPYHLTGQTNPFTDACQTQYERCALAGAPRFNPSYSIAANGTYVIPLSGGVEAAVLAAKRAVDRIALVLNHELEVPGANHLIGIEAVENAGTSEARLLITYRQHHLPAETGRRRQRGLITDGFGVTVGHIA